MGNIRDRLTIRPVTTEHAEQYDALMRYVFQVTEQQIEQSGYKAGELVRSKRPILEKADVIGWFTPDDEIVSQICIYPFSVNIHGKIMKMGGVTGVGTYPEYSCMGLMNDLVQLALERMRDAGQYISYLYPYSIPYYRRKGWEIMSDRLAFSFKDTQLPKNVPVKGHIERLSVVDEDVRAAYDSYSKVMHGAMMRGELEWEEYWRWENEDERIAAVYYDENEVPQGCMFYYVEDDVFYIKDIFYLTEDAKHGLWNFLAAHDPMIDRVKGERFISEPIAFELDDSQIEETISPYFMARIVDVENFLKLYPWDDEIQPLHFIVRDPIAKWNNGIFGITKGVDGSAGVVREPIGAGVELDIQTLSTMLMSYRSPSYLQKIERLKTDPATVRLLEQLIPDTQPYFSDYF